VSADALDAGNVVMLDGERRLADEERPVLRLSIIRDVALRACIRDLQNGRKQIGDSTSWAVASCTDGFWEPEFGAATVRSPRWMRGISAGAVFKLAIFVSRCSGSARSFFGFLIKSSR